MRKIVVMLLCGLFSGVLLLPQNVLANSKIDNSKEFSSPAAEQSFLTNGNLNMALDISNEVDAVFSNDGAKTYAYRSSGCSVGCSSGCSVGCSSGCSVGCSSGCSVGCSVGCY